MTFSISRDVSRPLRTTFCRLAPVLAATSLLALTPLAHSDTGFYVGGGVGQTDASEATSDTWKALAGINLSLPLLDIGAETTFFHSGDLRGGSFAAVAGLKTLGPVSVFGKAGMARWSIPGDVEYRKAQEDPLFGAGVRADVLPFSLRAEIERIEVSKGESQEFASISLTYSL